MTLNTHSHNLLLSGIRCPTFTWTCKGFNQFTLVHVLWRNVYRGFGSVVYDAMLLRRWFRRFEGEFAFTLSLQGAREEQIPLWHRDYWRSRWKVSSKRREKLSQWQRHSPEDLPFRKQKWENRERAISLTTHSLWKYHMTQPLLLVVSSRHTNFLHEKILL